MLSATKISEGSAVQNTCGGVSDLKKNREKRAMSFIGFDSMAERLSVFKWGQRSVNTSDDFSQKDLLRRSFEQIATSGSANAVHKTCAFQISQNCLQELLRKAFLPCDVANFDNIVWIAPCEYGESLQCVKPFLGDPHSRKVPTRDLPSRFKFRGKDPIWKKVYQVSRL